MDKNCARLFLTFDDVVKHYLLVKKNAKQVSGGHQNINSIAKIAELVAQQLEQLWHKVSIPTVSHTLIEQKIRQ